MTKINLAELKEKAEKATPGPWISCYRPEARDIHYIQEDDGSGYINPIEIASVFESGRDAETQRQTADFIAAANPQTVLKLIEALEVAMETLELYEPFSVEKGVTHFSAATEALAKIQEIIE